MAANRVMGGFSPSNPVTPDVRRAGQDVLVYLVGAVTSVQALSRAMEALLDDRSDLAVLYVATALVLALLGVTIERVKRFLGQ